MIMKRKMTYATALMMPLICALLPGCAPILFTDDTSPPLMLSNAILPMPVTNQAGIATGINFL